MLNCEFFLYTDTPFIKTSGSMNSAERSLFYDYQNMHFVAYNYVLVMAFR